MDVLKELEILKEESHVIEWDFNKSDREYVMMLLRYFYRNLDVKVLFVHGKKEKLKKEHYISFEAIKRYFGFDYQQDQKLLRKSNLPETKKEIESLYRVMITRSIVITDLLKKEKRKR
ncbi:MAG: hypothetical protein ACPGSO_00705 [Vicingaceae bacterium]